MKANGLKAIYSCSRSVLSQQCRRKAGASVRWSSTETRQWSTPLAKHLAEAIKTTGPISTAAYMRQCLISPESGYYMSGTEDSDQFGQEGDYITSPEISQIFGELLGIWIVTEWMAQGQRSKGVQLIELGPGRGTLMDDVLRTLRNFKGLASAIDAVYLVETSPSLRKAQKQLLCGEAPTEETSIGLQSRSKYRNTPITWCEHIRFVPNDPEKSPFILAHEFFDALPIHVFQSVASKPLDTTGPQSAILTPTGPTTLHKSTSANSTGTMPQHQWRELLVSPTAPATLPTTPSSDTSPAPEFQLSVANHPTPHSNLLPSFSNRYRALLSKPGSVIEISPEALSYAEDIARRIGSPKPPPPAHVTQTNTPHCHRQGEGIKSRSRGPSGAALIIDYGPSSTIPVNSLRGIRAHKQVSPFAAPGKVDVSADVDFTGLAEAALKASEGVEVHGPVEQGYFLEALGGPERVKQLVRRIESKCHVDEGREKRMRLEAGWKRLTERGGGGMGRIYKVLAIVPENGGRRRPVGFGGEPEV